MHKSCVLKFQDIWLFLTCNLVKVLVLEAKLRVLKSRYLWYRKKTHILFLLACFLCPLPAPKYMLRPHFPESIIMMPLFQIRPGMEWRHHSGLARSATFPSLNCSPYAWSLSALSALTPRAVSRGYRIGPDTTGGSLKEHFCLDGTILK